MADGDGPLRIVAIDGPAGSGKSTVARAVARRLGLDHLDTGAMYRAVAFAALQRGLDPTDAEPVARLAEQVRIDVDDVVLVDGVDATIEIRGPEVTRAVSAVAANAGVRRELVRRQRDWGVRRGGGVVEGRDIGTVVFPDAVLKIYLTASEDVRARRRAKESTDLHYDAVAADIARRDHVDATRDASPMAAADDALVIDTTDRSIDDVVEEVLGKL